MRWELYEEVEKETRNIIVNELNIPDIIVKVLLQREINTVDQIRSFFNPSLDQLHDPFLMVGMHDAVTRTIDAILEKQRIFIYGDYDVDGITSVSMLYLFLKDMGGEVRYYIPDRQTEGYGISASGVEEAIRWNANLIISVDCGITSVDEVTMAADAGIDVIVSDHHEPGETIPPAFAVLDPKRDEDDYPFHELAGVGVAYKLIQGISDRMELDADCHRKYLELVAVGSAADIVPLVDENRIFVKQGLMKLNDSGSIGIKALIEIANVKKKSVEVGQIVFGLAPRLNAVGRLGSAERAVELLTTKDASEARRIAQTLEEENRRRKTIDSKTLEEAQKKIDNEVDLVNDKAIILAEKDWHPGVIGIVASRIIEKYYRPTIMITIEDGIGKGSARSIPGFDIHQALKECSGLMLQFGGHKYAAGLTIEEKNIPQLMDCFITIANATIKEEDLIPRIDVDAEITLDQITPQVVHYLDLFTPFGPKNPKPIFVSRNLDVISPRMVGNNNQHLRFRVRQNGSEFDAIAFNLANKFKLVSDYSTPVDIVYTIEQNEWMNRTSTQLNIKDLR